MLNKAMFSPRNIAVIAAITLLTHVVAKPLYNKIDGK